MGRKHRVKPIYAKMRRLQQLRTLHQRTPSGISIVDHPERLLPMLTERTHIALVDLENICRWEVIRSRLAAPLPQTHVVYIAKKSFGLPTVAIPAGRESRAAIAGLFHHTSNVKDGSDHFITAIGVYLWCRLQAEARAREQRGGPRQRATLPLPADLDWRLQVISNDRMALACQATFDLLHHAETRHRR